MNINGYSGDKGLGKSGLPIQLDYSLLSRANFLHKNSQLGKRTSDGQLEQSLPKKGRIEADLSSCLRLPYDEDLFQPWVVLDDIVEEQPNFKPTLFLSDDLDEGLDLVVRVPSPVFDEVQQNDLVSLRLNTFLPDSVHCSRKLKEYLYSASRYATVLNQSEPGTVLSQLGLNTEMENVVSGLEKDILVFPDIHADLFLALSYLLGSGLFKLNKQDPWLYVDAKNEEIKNPKDIELINHKIIVIPRLQCSGIKDKNLVFLGDYCNRSTESAEVVPWLGMQKKYSNQILILM